VICPKLNVVGSTTAAVVPQHGRQRKGYIYTSHGPRLSVLTPIGILDRHTHLKAGLVANGRGDELPR
jgi:hypothetical protein